MAETDETIPESFGPEVEEESVTRPRLIARRRWRRRAIAQGLVLLAILASLWVARIEIADSVISGQLEDFGLPATYEIESIGPGRQVLRHVVIGDPAHPDMTIERAEMTIVPRLGMPRVSRLKLEQARLYGSYRAGKLSFGSLDALLFARTEEPTRLPDMDLTLEDGRALVRTDFGDVGFKAEGGGGLQGGFAGILAATAPELAGAGCTARGTTLFGKISVTLARPHFNGPLRVASLRCPDSGVALGRAAVTLAVQGDEDLAGLELDASLKSGALAVSANRLDSLGGTIKATWRAKKLTGRYDLTGRGVATGAARITRLAIEGDLRGNGGLSRIELLGNVTGEGVRPGDGFDATLAGWGKSAQGTLLAPMLAQIRQSLAREGRSSRLAASFTLRRKDGQTSLVVPNASLRGSSGASLFSLSRFQFGGGGEGGPYLSGNFVTGGPGLPQLAGRMEGQADGLTRLNFAMPEYRAGDSMLALPELAVIRQPGGAVGFSGSMAASGALPGGSVRRLVLPLSGNWSSAAGLSLWRRCTNVRFDHLEIANLTLDRRGLELCPVRGGAILRSDSRGVRIAAGASRLDLAGRLGETPIRIASGAVGFAVPGRMTARQVEVTLGTADSPTRLTLGNLDARIGSETIGHFGGAEFTLFAVPLDVHNGSGNWRYGKGRLSLSGAQFGLEDRQQNARFQPLIARDAGLVLEDGQITAQALLREPTSDHAVTRVTLRHELASASGRADLAVEGLVFDKQLQPDMLSRLALGVIANTFGTVTGSGQIEWAAKGVTSSGAFSSQGLDFAAAFGPAQGVSGTVVFTDLVGLTTAPEQVLQVRSINPGIEAHDGEIIFDLASGEVLSLRRARWPFLGGTLTMEPVSLRVGVAETRRYVIKMDAVDAGQFIAQMELGNISASGTFDGILPLVFDENGGRIDGGLLTARPPGGSVSYVGELTYKDLSPMANFAFDALRALDYREMEVGLNGPLTGEIVTKVRFDGIKQGVTAKRNLITRQIAKLPIRFNVNIRAPFYQLITSIKAMYDPAFIRDPRELGLIDKDGKPVDNPVIPNRPMMKPNEITPDALPVQPPESEDTP